MEKKKERIKIGWQHELEKYERKKNAELKKKEEQYRRKMLNEIREIEWKPKREYKTEWPKIKPLQFAMELAQENARLRDTDADGNGYCISCNKWCSWENLSGGHRYSRRFQHICLEVENINAQCRSCNWATWPRGDTVAKERVNDEYDKNIDKKWGGWTAAKLKKKLRATLKWKWHKYDLSIKMPILIRENEALWREKNFYKPKKNWRKLWEAYDKRH